MIYLLFFIYLLIVCWLLLRSAFIQRAGLGNRTVVLLFLTKVSAGFVIGWLSIHYYTGGNDYWDNNRAGWEEYQLLWKDPYEYFTNLFRSPYSSGYGGFFDSFSSFWNDLKNNLLIKLLSLFNIFSRGNYYINSLFFNYLIFFGHVALYRVFLQIYPGKSIRVIIGCFLLPSLLYFSSGIHRDGIVFLALALLVYCLFVLLYEKKTVVKQYSVIIGSILLLFLLRSYVLLLLVPAIVAWFLSVKMKWPVIPTYAIIYGIAVFALFNIGKIFPAVDPIAVIVKKQSDYLALPIARTSISLDTLRPAFKSFWQNAPQAFNHILLRPYPFELPSGILLPMNIELLFYHLIFLFFIIFGKWAGPSGWRPFFAFSVFFTLTVFLFIGYMVPNLGTLVRYRSLYLPFIITPLICGLSLENLSRRFKF